MEEKSLEEMSELLKKSRYDDGKGYFWINDLSEPYTIMKYHPISEALIGKEFKNDKYNVVGEEKDQPKLSYGKKIGEDMMIGTGFYIDDINKMVAIKTESSNKVIMKVIFINILITFIILVIGIVIIAVISKLLCRRLGFVSETSYELAKWDLTLRL